VARSCKTGRGQRLVPQLGNRIGTLGEGTAGDLVIAVGRSDHVVASRCAVRIAAVGDVGDVGFRTGAESHALTRHHVVAVGGVDGVVADRATRVRGVGHLGQDGAAAGLGIGLAGDLVVAPADGDAV